MTGAAAAAAAAASASAAAVVRSAEEAIDRDDRRLGSLDLLDHRTTFGARFPAERARLGEVLVDEMPAQHQLIHRQLLLSLRRGDGVLRIPVA